MTRLTRRRARSMRAAAMHRLADLIDELEPGSMHPDVEVEYRTVVALDAALAGAPWWRRTVQVTLPARFPAPSAHKQLVTR